VSCQRRGPHGGRRRLVEGPAAPLTKREGHLWVNFGGGHATTTLTEKGVAVGRSCLHFGEGGDSMTGGGQEVSTPRGSERGCFWAIGLVREGGGGWGVALGGSLPKQSRRKGRERGPTRCVGEEEGGGGRQARARGSHHAQGDCGGVAPIGEPMAEAG
jgi:hypothetical protein